MIATHAWQVLSGVGVGPLRAVERLGEDAGERRLAGASRAGEQVGLPDLALLDRVRERPHDRLLPDDLRERLGAVLAVERGHPSIQADSSRASGRAVRCGPAASSSPACAACRSGSRSSNEAPAPATLWAEHEPPCARAIAATIASPSPAPPSRRDRDASVRANRSKISSREDAGIPSPPSVTTITTSFTSPWADSSIAVFVGVVHRVLEDRVECRPKPCLVRVQRHVHDLAEPPGAWCNLRPAHEHVLQERNERNRRAARSTPVRSARASSSTRSTIRSIRASSSNATLSSGVSLAEAALEQLQVPAGDRHRRTELVRDVVEQPLLAARAAIGALLGERLDRRQRLGPTACMPHHREEHRRHQRHLEELAPELQPVEGIGEDRRAGGDDDAPEHGAVVGRAQTRKP